MGHQFTNGKHQYKGRFSGSGTRKRSKLYKGIWYNKKALKKAFDKIVEEKKTKQL